MSRCSLRFLHRSWRGCSPQALFASVEDGLASTLLATRHAIHPGRCCCLIGSAKSQTLGGAARKIRRCPCRRRISGRGNGRCVLLRALCRSILATCCNDAAIRPLQRGFMSRWWLLVHNKVDSASLPPSIHRLARKPLRIRFPQVWEPQNRDRLLRHAAGQSGLLTSWGTCHSSYPSRHPAQVCRRTGRPCASVTGLPGSATSCEAGHRPSDPLDNWPIFSKLSS